MTAIVNKNMNGCFDVLAARVAELEIALSFAITAEMSSDLTNIRKICRFQSI